METNLPSELPQIPPTRPRFEPMESPKQFSLKFPIWQYLTQPLFEDGFELRINPKAFWKDYQVDFLEHCLMITSESSNPN